MEITTIVGREILDRRGNPTVEADMALDHSPVPADGHCGERQAEASDYAAAEHRSSVRRLNFNLSSAAYDELERLTQACEEGAARCRTVEAALDQLSLKQQADEQELRNLQEALSRQAEVISGASARDRFGPEEDSNTERTIHRWLFERLDIAHLMGTRYRLLLARPVAATVCLIAVLAFSAYESREVLEFLLSLIRVLATFEVASILVERLCLKLAHPGVLPNKGFKGFECPQTRLGVGMMRAQGAARQTRINDFCWASLMPELLGWRNFGRGSSCLPGSRVFA
jgi:hypothetical protein